MRSNLRSMIKGFALAAAVGMMFAAASPASAGGLSMES